MTEPHASEPAGVPAPGRQPFDAPMVTALVAVAGAAVLITLGMGIATTARAALGAATGGALATVNLWAFAHIVRGVLGGGQAARLWALAGIAKLLLLLGGAWWLLDQGLLSGGALAIGYAALPLGVSAAALVSRRMAPTEPKPGGAPDGELVTAAPTERELGA